jgi:hypothetical protein
VGIFSCLRLKSSMALRVLSSKLIEVFILNYLFGISVL